MNTFQTSMTDENARREMKASGFTTAAQAPGRYSSPLLDKAWSVFKQSGGDFFLDEYGGVFKAPRILKRRPVI